MRNSQNIFCFSSILAGILLFLVQPSLTGQRTISGTVIDGNGYPLIFANIHLQNTQIGAATDVDGNYEITIPGTEGTLVFSYIGFVTQEMAIGSSDRIDVTLIEGINLENIVISAIGLEADKRQLGYAIEKVDVDAVVSAREENLVDALNSKVAGVSVTSTSGNPGASARIRIRGNNSITGSSSPLFILDGVPLDNTSYSNQGNVDWSNRVMDINPQDIESITVLKGASAAALYGVRANNGAVIIATKSGKLGDPIINVTSTYSFDRVNKLPDMQDTYAQGIPVNGIPAWRGPETRTNFSYGPPISSLEFDGSEYDYDRNGRLVPSGSGNGIPARAYDPFTFFETGNTHEVNASVQGGNEFVNYYISGGRHANTGVVPKSTWKKQSFRVNLSSKLSEKLTAGMSANFINSGGSRAQRGNNFRGVMVGLLRTSPTFDIGNGKTGSEAANDINSYIRLSDGGQRSYNAGVYDNPYWSINKNGANDDVNRLIGYFSLKYEFSTSLSLEYKLGLDQYSDRAKWYVDINPGVRDDGFLTNYAGHTKNLNSDLLLKFKRQLHPNWSVNAVLGYNYYDQYFSVYGENGEELAIPDFPDITNSADVTGFESLERKRIHAAFSTIDISYRDYLFLNLTGRNDWSSSLPIENNQFKSYSSSLGFAFTEAFDMQGNDILSYGKLRLSYGVVGKDAPIYSTFNYFERAIIESGTFTGGFPFPAFGTATFERSNLLGNNQLRPEKTITWEYGAELDFFRGRFGMDLTYFDSKTQDLILDVEIPASTGFSNISQNSGLITNKGWEVVLHASPVNQFDFGWDLDLNFTQLENIVVELAEGTDQIGLNGPSSAIPGQPYGVFFTNGWQRDENGTVVIGSHGYPLEDSENVIAGDPNPDYTMGLRNTVRWKGFTLAALLDIRKGGDLWCGTCTAINHFGTSQETADLRNEVVVFDGVLEDGTPNDIAVKLADPTKGVDSYYWVRYGFPGVFEANVYDGSWVRLRDLTLSYSLPHKLLGKGFLKAVNISLSGRNLWLKTNFPGIDPETNLSGDSNGFGFDYFGTPNTKSYSATIKMTF